ncbi:MAG: DNA primase [Bacteroidetes bacterium]|nr:DNA primase [Bacteroidota bacterium]MBL6944592.1 DNA primase [Bacteroidales bacterium]
MINPNTIQTIFETAHVEEVVGDFVSLKKRGVNYLGLCPFHNEKTPSFSVSPSKGIYKCFGCGKAGNVVGFVMEHEHYSYPEALRYLAKRYGIEIEEKEVTLEMQQQLDEKESMLALNNFVTKYFTKNLFEKNEGKAIGLSYLKERDFRESTIEKFELGYAIDQWEDYSKHALANGFKKDILVLTGLGIDKDDKIIDRFRGRVIFPIHNLTGRVIGFGGRILSSEKSKAKYLNSPESDIYNKSKVLYGIYFARNAIAKQNKCYLVEGYTDVISLHQAGIENVVASSGTSLTVDQIKLISRYTNNITILYDGDPAGIKASFRGIDLILEQGMNVKIVLFPEDEDPDSYARNHSTKETEDFIVNTALDFIKFKTSLLQEETADDPAGKASLIKDIVHTISIIPDGISRSVYIKECSVLLDVREQTLMNELNKLLRQKFRKQSNIPADVIPIDEIKDNRFKQIDIDPLDISYLENDLTRLLLLFGDMKVVVSTEENEKLEISISDFIINDLENDKLAFENKIYSKIIDEFKKAREDEDVHTTAHFTNHPDPQISSVAIELISTPYELSRNWKKNKIFVKKEDDDLMNMVLSTLMSFKSRLISKKLHDISQQMKVATDEAEIYLLQQEYFELKKLTNLIDAELNRPFNY